MDKNTRDLLEAVNFIKDNMVTKEEFREGLADSEARIRRDMATKKDLKETEERLHDEIVSKTNGIHQRLDEELDQRKMLQVRVAKLERSGR